MKSVSAFLFSILFSVQCAAAEDVKLNIITDKTAKNDEARARKAEVKAYDALCSQEVKCKKEDEYSIVVIPSGLGYFVEFFPLDYSTPWDSAFIQGGAVRCSGEGGCEVEGYYRSADH